MGRRELARHPTAGGSRTRSEWEGAFALLMSPIVAVASGSRGELGLPDPPGPNGVLFDRFEALCRSLWMAAPWMSTHPTARLSASNGDVDLAAFYRRAIAAGTDRSHPATWHAFLGSRRVLVEAPAVAWALWTARASLWDPLDDDEKSRVLAWLSATTETEPFDNNWRLFSVLLHTVCKRLGGAFDQAAIDAHLDAVESWYLEDGWYNDGPPRGAVRDVDYYNAFVLHPYLLYWTWLDGDDRPERAARIIERARVFQKNFSDWFAPDGSYPCFGRSTAYRMGVTHVFGAALLTGAPGLEPGEARRLCESALFWSLGHEGAVAQGIPTRGFARELPDMAEPYLGPGSVYWAAKAFVPLALGDAHPFWSESAPLSGRSVAVRAEAGSGFLIHADRETGHVQVVNAAATARPKAYSNLAYSSHFGYEVPPSSEGLVDPHGEASLTLSRDGLSWYVRAETVDFALVGGTLFTLAIYRLPGARLRRPARVATAVRFVDDRQVRVHRIDSPVRVHVREGGFALGWSGDEAPEHGSHPCSFARASSGASAISSLRGYAVTEVPQASDRNVLHARSLIPHVRTAEGARRFELASISLARPEPFDPDELFHPSVGDIEPLLASLADALRSRFKV